MENTELIKALKEDAEWAHANEWETPITLGDHLDAAAGALEAADKRVKEMEEAQRWIPVEERLPELPDVTYCPVECNVIAAGNKPFATSMYYERTMRRGKAVERWMWHDRISPWEVTHWQPLPQPPQKGE